MRNFRKEYRDLEIAVISELKNKIRNSEKISKFVNEKAIPVNVFDYDELTIINEKLTFIDCDGLHYSLFAICELNDLIEILESL